VEPVEAVVEDVVVPAVVPVVVLVVDVEVPAVEEVVPPEVLRVEPRSSLSHTDMPVFSSPVERKIFSSQRT
jgi:hypothetical protein